MMTTKIPILELLAGCQVRVWREGKPSLEGRLREVRDTDDGPLLIVVAGTAIVNIPWSETTRVKQLGPIT
jgi:hypothetical protein